MEYGQHDRHKGSSLAMGLQYFCYGTLNSYEFSNATTAVNNGESARNKGGRTRGMGERNTFLPPPPPSPRLFFFVVSPGIRKVSATDRSIDRSIFVVSRARKLSPCRKKEIKSLASDYCFLWFFLLVYSMNSFNKR